MADINDRLQRLQRREEFARRAHRPAAPPPPVDLAADFVEVLDAVARVVGRHPGLSVMVAAVDGRPGRTVIRVTEREGAVETAVVPPPAGLAGEAEAGDGGADPDRSTPWLVVGRHAGGPGTEAGPGPAERAPRAGEPPDPGEPGQGRPGPDHAGPDRPGPDRLGPDRPGPDRPGPDRPGPDRPGPDHAGPDHAAELRPRPEQDRHPDLDGPDLDGPDRTAGAGYRRSAYPDEARHPDPDRRLGLDRPAGSGQYPDSGQYPGSGRHLGSGGYPDPAPVPPSVDAGEPDRRLARFQALRPPLSPVAGPPSGRAPARDG